MASEDPNTTSPSDNPLRLIEAASLAATADPAMNAVRVEVCDEAGEGVAFLVGPPEAAKFVMATLRALGDLAPLQ